MHVEVIVGRVGRAHGIRGDVSIDVTTDEPARRFAKGAKLRLGKGEEVEVASVRQHQGRLLVSFKGFPDRTSVEALTGEQLWASVPEDEEPSEDNEYFDRQLVGLEVRRADGQPAGIITAINHFPAQDLLVIDVQGEERLVPFVEALVPVVDVAAGHIQLADVDGLLEDLE